MDDEKKPMKENYMLRLWHWICGSNPQGIGTLLVGIAAIFALLQTSSILDKILEVQKQAKQIEDAVTQLKSQGQQISSAIDLLGTQLKELKAAQTIDSSPALQNPNPTVEQIKDAIKNIPTKPSTKRSTIFLPSSKIDGTVEMIHKAKTPAARAAILQNSLEYQPSGFLVDEFLADENDDNLTTEDGAKIIIEDKPTPPKKK